MKRKSVFLVLLVILSLNLSCAGKHPADVAATVVIPGTEGYLTVQRELITMNERDHLFSADTWKQISAVRNQASHAYNLVWDAWYTLSFANTPENVQDFNGKLAQLATFVAELQNFIKGVKQ